MKGCEVLVKMNHDFYKELLDTMSDGVYFVDTERKITYWNRGAEKITGFTSQEVIGKHCRDNILIHIDEKGANLCLDLCPLTAVMQDSKPCVRDVFLHHKEGHRVPVSVRVNPMYNTTGQIIGAVEVFNDVSEKVSLLERLEELEKIVYIDPLTGLANRPYTELCLNDRFQELKRYGWPFGVVFMDIDSFKRINDRLGHDVGDKAIKMVAQALLKSTRSFDITGRWAGDEFVAIILNIDKKNLARIAERFRMLVEQSKIPVGHDMIGVTISAGALLANLNINPEDLIKKADELMYRSKSAGGNLISFED
jgi:diguanylate cyclase (GGDEF)-like protein/PAS domain S-box-containing protein